MAGDWIKCEACTPDKPEVFGIAAALNIDPDAVLGKLMRIWIWADQQTISGNAPSVTSALLDRIAGVTGFAEAMRKEGWLVGGDSAGRGAEFPNFDRHNGQTAKQRALTSKRVKRFRNAPSVTSALPEKRREEKNLDVALGVPNATIGAEPASPLSAPASRLWGKPPIQFDRDAQHFIGVTARHRQQWSEAYPAVDLASEIARAEVWIVSNPAQGRKSSYVSFLARWFSRVQDRGGSQNGRQQQSSPGAGAGQVWNKRCAAGSPLGEGEAAG